VKRLSPVICFMVVVGVLAPTSMVLADCQPDGTAADDTIVCTGNDLDGVYGGEGDDTITNDGAAAHLTGDTTLFIGPIAGDDTIINNGTTEQIIGDLAFDDGGDDTIINNGTVNMVIVGDDVANGQGGNDTITNNGVIQQTIFGDAAQDGGDDTITNNGTVGWDILGDSASSGGNDVIVNTGTVDGSIYGDNADTNPLAGDDTIINSGTVGGVIDAEAGDDTVTLEDGANGGADDVLVIDGGAGTDVLVFSFTITDPELYDQIAAEIAAQSPAGGSITINGQTYIWSNFEQLVNLLRFAGTRPVTVRLNDGRLNFTDLAAPFAVYCVAGGGIVVYDIQESGQGFLAFQATWAEISDALTAAAERNENILIVTAMDDSLWALPSGDLLASGPEITETFKTYEFTFAADRCSPDNGV